MALTAYCKKCGMEVEPGEICSRCGTRLGKNAAHAAWCVERRPVSDWMYWNSVMRLLLPSALLILLLVLLAEILGGGIGALERMIASGFLPVLLLLFAGALALVFAALLLQGKELSDFVVDSRGIHETRYLPGATKLKLLARLKSPALLKDAAGEERVVKLSERDLPWKNVARVQLWPEKCMILFYAPGWWLRIPVICTPFSWEDTMGMIREKLGKKKKVRLPASLVQPAGPARRRTGRREPAQEQMRLEDLESAVPKELLPWDDPVPAPRAEDDAPDEPNA